MKNSTHVAGAALRTGRGDIEEARPAPLARMARTRRRQHLSGGEPMSDESAPASSDGQSAQETPRRLPAIACAPWCRGGPGHISAQHPDDQYCDTGYLVVELQRQPTSCISPTSPMPEAPTIHPPGCIRHPQPVLCSRYGQPARLRCACRPAGRRGGWVSGRARSQQGCVSLPPRRGAVRTGAAMSRRTPGPGNLSGTLGLGAVAMGTDPAHLPREPPCCGPSSSCS
jgi:hypothetical protein